MGEGIIDDYLGQSRKSFFNNQGSKMPVIATFDRIKFITWGKRELEPNDFPVGSTLYREDILNGKYDLFSPKPVKLHILKFLEKDIKGMYHWFDIVKGLYMQGLLINNGSELRVYVVTIRTQMPDSDYNYWPRLIYESQFISHI